MHVHFSQKFDEAVEAKQIAEQEAKKAEFVALKASKEAEAKVNLAKGQAEVHKWDGKLPLIVGEGKPNFLNRISEFFKSYQ